MIYVRQSTRLTNNGIGFLGALTILFALKLTGLIDWSWWLVTIPLWIIPSILLGIGVFAGLIWLVLVAIQAHEEKRRKKRRNHMGS